MYQIIKSVKIKGNKLKIYIDFSKNNSQKLIEDFENCRISWITERVKGNPEKSIGEIYSVNIEDESILSR